jgi:hypothetical protein
MVLPVMPVPGVATTIADAMGREVTAELREAGFAADGPDVTAGALPADCRPDTAGSPGSPRTRSPSFPGCACGVAQARNAQLVVVGRVSRLTTKMTLTLVAYATATCAPLSAEGTGQDEIAASNASRVAEAATRALVQQMSGTLAVTATPSEAEIVVAGEARGTGSVEVRLLEGSYDVEGRLDGWTPARETAAVAAGQRAELSLALTRLDGDGGPPPDGNGGHVPAPSRPSWQTPAAIGAVGLGGLLGITLAAAATQIGECTETTASDCRTSYEVGAPFVIGLVAAGVLVVGGVVLYLIDLDGSE